MNLHFNKNQKNKNMLNEVTNPASCQTDFSGSWFDFYGSKNANRNIVYPKIDENVEFETTNGLTLHGEFANKHSVGVFWAKNCGYFYDEEIVRWRPANCH